MPRLDWKELEKLKELVYHTEFKYKFRLCVDGVMTEDYECDNDRVFVITFEVGNDD